MLGFPSTRSRCLLVKLDTSRTQREELCQCCPPCEPPVVCLSASRSPAVQEEHAALQRERETLHSRTDALQMTVMQSQGQAGGLGRVSSPAGILQKVGGLGSSVGVHWGCRWGLCWYVYAMSVQRDCGVIVRGGTDHLLFEALAGFL